MLYPFQFAPRKKTLPWGSETWLLSGLAGDETRVTNGFLAGNSPSELVEIYMGELLGDAAYLRFGDEFPLLVKAIDTHDVLSVQVHPDDELAAKRHNAYGKDEMWHILAAEPNAELLLGFREGVTREMYERALAESARNTGDGSANAGTMDALFNHVPVRSGDTFYVPAGTVHAIGAGISLIEVQEPSDITYRIFDHNRKPPRELHTELAADAIDFAAPARVIRQKAPQGEAALLVESAHFTVNLLSVAGAMARDFSTRDGFTLYICTGGSVSLADVELKPRDLVLVPADNNAATLKGDGAVLEVHL